MNCIELTSENISDIIKSDGLVVIDFWADWCSPCKILSPIIEEFAVNNKDIIVGKLNVVDYGTLTASFGVRNLPTLMFYKNGEKVKQTSGVISLEKLQGIIDNM